MIDTASDILDVAVIGAGAAGLLAGIAAARAGARAVVFERMRTPARKVALAGGGRCNFSNTLDARRFVRLFGDKNATYLGHALRAFSNEDLIALLARHGVEGQLEKDYRLYTRSGRGADVVEALRAELREAGAELATLARITSIRRDAERGVYDLEDVRGDTAERRRARTVVICTGGLSYPATGSTGDGYAWARAFGHKVTELRPALVGLTTLEEWPRALQGLAWPDAQAALWPDGTAAPPAGKPLGSERAELLFTHFGLSGPAIMDLSNVFVGSGLRSARLTLDFFPDVPRGEMDARLVARFRQFPGRAVRHALEGMLRPRLLEALARQLGADEKVSAGRFSKEARGRLLTLLKSAPVTIVGTRGVEHGEVTAGGVAWEELNPATLESRLAPGLFFAGEILDLAGRCGGFNLQAAFSTGWLAGRQAAQAAIAGRR